MMSMFEGVSGGGGSPDPGAFQERPGENWAQGGGRGGFTPEMRVLFQAARALTGGGRFRGGGQGGGGEAPLADAGEYAVILRAGDRELRQSLRVLKGPHAGEGGGFFQTIR
jgi:hypothetical protein